MVSPLASSEPFDRETIERMMSSPTGRRFVTDLLDTCGVYRQSFVPGCPPETMAFREGERSVGLRVFGAVQTYAAGNYQRAIDERRVRLEAVQPAALADDGSAE